MESRCRSRSATRCDIIYDLNRTFDPHLLPVTASFQLLTFMLVAELYRRERFPAFEYAQPGESHPSGIHSF